MIKIYVNNNAYFLKPELFNIIIKIKKIIKIIKKVNILYKLSWSKDKSPNAIPSFQIKLIFKYFDI